MRNNEKKCQQTGEVRKRILATTKCKKKKYISNCFSVSYLRIVCEGIAVNQCPASTVRFLITVGLECLSCWVYPVHSWATFRIFVFYNFTRLARVLFVFTGFDSGSGGWSWRKFWSEITCKSWRSRQWLKHRTSNISTSYRHWTQSMQGTHIQNTGP